MMDFFFFFCLRIKPQKWLYRQTANKQTNKHLKYYSSRVYTANRDAVSALIIDF